MESDVPLLGFILFLILLSGIFSAAEIALFSLSPAKVRSFFEQKKRGAKAVQRLKDHPHDLLVTILIMNNFINISASVLATAWATAKFDSNVIGYVTGVITFLVIVFGEIIPKTFGQKYADNFSRFIAPFILFLEYLLKPFVWFFSALAKGMMKIFQVSDSPIKSFTEEELLAMVDIGTEEGELEQEEKELIENVLDFADITVEEVMTPRPQMDVLDEEATLEDAIQYINAHSHSRIPVYRETIDNIIGVVSVRHILHFSGKHKKETQLKELELPKPYIIPESMLINDLFKEFQRKRTHLAIVVDEHGGVSGLITMENILEEIVGDIVDESDIEKVLIKRTGPKTWILSGEAIIEEINQAVGVTLPAPEFKNISFLILEELQEMPKIGDKIDLGTVELLVEKMNENKIEVVRLLKKE